MLLNELGAFPAGAGLAATGLVAKELGIFSPDVGATCFYYETGLVANEFGICSVGGGVGICLGGFGLLISFAAANAC